jgi:hypothetical protein
MNLFKKSIGKITSIKFGFGGYQDVQFGITIIINTKIGCCCTGMWCWAHKPDEYCKWTTSDQDKRYMEIMRYVIKLMQDAKVNEIHELIGKPIEATWHNNMLESFRILTEAIL